MTDQGGAPDEPSPQGSSKGRGTQRSGGKPQGDPVPAAPASADDDSGEPGAGLVEIQGTDDLVDQADQGDVGTGAPLAATLDRPSEPVSKTLSSLLRFQRKSKRRP